MLGLLKRIINFGLKKIFSLGIGNMLHRFNQDKITIIMIHGVMYNHKHVLWTPLRKQITPDTLENTIRILSERYTFISLEDAKNIIKGSSPAVKNGLVFTLDDGYWNNLTYASDVFKKYAIKPTIFVATKNVDQGSPFWFDRLDYALQQLTGNSFSVLLGSEKFNFDTSSREKLDQSYAKFRDRCKVIFSTDEEMLDALNRISTRIETETGKALTDIIKEDDWTRIASWNELTEASDNGYFDIGSHTIDHNRLAFTNTVNAQEQLSGSKEKIETQLEKACPFFCYPNGSFDDTIAKMVADKGYELAVTTQMGLNSLGDDLMKLKRFAIPTHKKRYDVLYALSSFRL
jgi:peptidoglycan/xylan/chitin deacetylase (PgdA/CDA1 family)